MPAAGLFYLFLLCFCFAAHLPRCFFVSQLPAVALPVRFSYWPLPAVALPHAFFGREQEKRVPVFLPASSRQAEIRPAGNRQEGVACGCFFSGNPGCGGFSFLSSTNKLSARRYRVHFSLWRLFFFLLSGQAPESPVSGVRRCAMLNCPDIFCKDINLFK